MGYWGTFALFVLGLKLHSRKKGTHIGETLLMTIYTNYGNII